MITSIWGDPLPKLSNLSFTINYYIGFFFFNHRQGEKLNQKLNQVIYQVYRGNQQKRSN